jgi:Ca2+-binding EF-hand superfamily protein
MRLNRDSRYAKLNTEEMFKAVDKDGDGRIEFSEWMEFWREVKRAGHGEQEISQEVRAVSSSDRVSRKWGGLVPLF